jgi:hypothetical protein
MANTGYKGWNTLEEYNVSTGQATGNTKPNVDTDPDYVEPVYDTDACPLPQPEPKPEPAIVLSPATYEAEYKDFFTLQVTSNSDWTLESDSNWLVLLSTTSGSGDASIQVSVSKNDTGEDRFGSISAKDSNGVVQDYCNVTQRDALSS